MNVALIGATGRAGAAILAELLSRGHRATAISRNVDTTGLPFGVPVRNADIFHTDDLAAALRGHDAVISAAWFWPGSSEPLVAGIAASGVNRALFVGGASSLLADDGRQLVDVLDMPCDWMDTIREGVHLLDVLRQGAGFDWTFISPPLEIEVGPRVGTYRTDPNHLVVNREGRSTISFADYAIAMVDALENGSAIRDRFGVGY
mgnify:CR=1 FL=1